MVKSTFRLPVLITLYILISMQKDIIKQLPGMLIIADAVLDIILKNDKNKTKTSAIKA